MTGYTVHTGSNDKFSSGWDHIFSGGKDKKAAKKAEAGAKKAATAKAAKKDAGGKKAARKAKRGK